MTSQPPVYAPSYLSGAARELQRDLLGAYRRALAAHGGRVVSYRLGPPRVGVILDVAFQPDAARRILATDGEAYDKGVPMVEELRAFVGLGLVTSDGNRWRRDRRIVAPIFTPRQVAGHVDDTAAAARRFADGWREAAAAGIVVDANAGAIRYTLDVLGRTVFGEDVGPFADLLERAVPMFSEHAARRSLSPVRVPASWPTPANRRTNRVRDEVWAMVDELVQRRRREPVGRRDLVSELLAARDPTTGEGLDDVAVRDQALTFLIAGHETSASAMAFALHLLGSHPDVQEKLRSEVAAVLGDKPVTAATIERLVYVRQVVDETLRIYPPVHTVVRRAMAENSIGEHRLPKGRMVAVSVWGVHHNPAVWPDPERFDPDRFVPSEDGDEHGGVDRYAHLAFGGGPRGCIAHSLAMNEQVAGLATLISTYGIEALDRSLELDVGVTLRPRGPVRLRLTNQHRSE